MTEEKSNPFYIKDCVLAPIATGIKAQTLNDFRERLATIHPGSIFNHFWRGRLESNFELREFYNDFSYWAHYSLHDDILAEKLEILNPADYENIEDLRTEMLEIIDSRIDELEIIPWSKLEEQFYFIRSKIVVFSTSHVANEPKDLVKIIPLLSRSSIFYHFIEARRHTLELKDDFSTWLKSFKDDFSPLIERLSHLDPYFISLADLQNRISTEVTEFFLKKLQNNNNEGNNS